MPLLLVGLKMKSALPKPKPVHSALPIPQKPSRPSALNLNVKTTPVKSLGVSTAGQNLSKAKRARVERPADSVNSDHAQTHTEHQPALETKSGSCKLEMKAASATGGSLQVGQ